MEGNEAWFPMDLPLCWLTIYLNYNDIFCYDHICLASSPAERFGSNMQAAMVRSGIFRNLLTG